MSAINSKQVVKNKHRGHINKVSL